MDEKVCQLRSPIARLASLSIFCSARHQSHLVCLFVGHIDRHIFLMKRKQGEAADVLASPAEPVLALALGLARLALPLGKGLPPPPQDTAMTLRFRI